MKENIKLIARIASKTTFKWFIIFALGNIITLITFLTALFTNLDLIDGGGRFAAHSGGGAGGIMLIVAYGAALFFANFFAFILLFGAPIFLFLYFSIANKISIQNALYLLWKGKASDYISSKVKNLISKLTEKEGWQKNISNKLMLKARLLQLAKEDKDSSRLQRKVISFGFKKINLDDIDFKDEKLNLSDVLTTKFENFISEISKPSMKMFWLLVFAQIIFLIISLIIR